MSRRGSVFRLFSRTSLLITIICFLYLPYTIFADCKCGYAIPILTGSNTTTPELFTDAIETDFTTLKGLLNGKSETEWAPQNYTVPSPASNGPWGKNASLQNVEVNTEGASLLVRGSEDSKPEGGLVGMAELATRRDDILYGSLRAGIGFAEEEGTCGAFFWYHSDTAELDIEYLSAQQFPSNSSYPVNLVLQSPSHNPSNNPLFSTPSLPFDPSRSIHEYRIDWTPTAVSWYVDNTLLNTTTSIADIPTTGGHLSLSHWSNGNKGWSAGPPTEDARMRVRWVRAYFNSSRPEREGLWEKGCNTSKEKDKGKCEIKAWDGKSAAPEFFDANAAAGKGGGKGKESKGALSGRMTWLDGCLLMLLLLVQHGV